MTDRTKTICNLAFDFGGIKTYQVYWLFWKNNDQKNSTLILAKVTLSKDGIAKTDMEDEVESCKFYMNMVRACSNTK